MNDSVSEHANAPFVESTDKPTILGYGDGGVPIYIGILWVAFIVAYAVVMLVLALPDFRAWASQ